MKLIKFVPLIIFLGLGVFLVKGLSLSPRSLPSVLLDKPVPNFSLPRLQHDSLSITQADFKGHLSLLNVWATWCLACREDHEFLMKLKDEGFIVYGLNYKDDKRSAIQWLKLLGNPYKSIGFDNKGLVAIDFGVYGTPETFLIDDKGIIRYRYAGVLNQQSWQKNFMPIIQQLSDARV